MKEIKEITLKDEEKQNKNGYQVIIKNLDNGEEVINVKTRAIVGAYATEIGVEGMLSSAGLCITSCDGKTLMATIQGAERVIERTKDKMFGDIMPDFIKAFLESLK